MAEFDIKTLIQKPQHIEVFNWLCEIQGKTPERLAKEILTVALVRELPTYREAMGGGGRSSRDIQGLANRLR